MTWQAALMTAAIALATAIAGGWFNKPKTRGEGKKGEGEGKQAEGAGSKFEAEGQVALSQEWRAERDDILRKASEARVAAEAANIQCQSQVKHMREDFGAFIDVMKELVPLLPEGESQRKAWVAIRAAELVI